MKKHMFLYYYSEESHLTFTNHCVYEKQTYCAKPLRDRSHLVQQPVIITLINTLIKYYCKIYNAKVGVQNIYVPSATKQQHFQKE